jgi:hypothetical protein
MDFTSGCLASCSESLDASCKSLAMIGPRSSWEKQARVKALKKGLQIHGMMTVKKMEEFSSSD